MDAENKLYEFYKVYSGARKQNGGAQSIFNANLPIDERVKMASNTKNLLGASTNFLFTILTFIYEVIIVKSLEIINVFYGLLNSQLQMIDGTTVGSDKNEMMMKSIENVIKNPEFKRQWEFFSQELAELLGQLLDKVKEQTDKQLDSISNDVVKLAGENTKAIVMSMGLGIMDGICAIPPFLPICELMLVAGAGSKLTSQTFMTFLRTVNKMADSFEVVFGGEAEKVASFIKKWKSIYKEINDTIDGLTNIPTNIVNNATNSINASINDKIDHSITNVNDGINKSISNVNDGVNKKISNVSDGINKSISNVSNGVNKKISSVSDGIDKSISKSVNKGRNVIKGGRKTRKKLHRR